MDVEISRLDQLISFIKFATKDRIPILVEYPLAIEPKIGPLDLVAALVVPPREFGEAVRASTS
jgi:hypothetical protein